MAAGSPCASASDHLVDKESFREIGSVAGKAEYDGRNELVELTPANAVMGRAKIDGRPVAVIGDDFTVRGGSADRNDQGKVTFIEQYANQYRVPIAAHDRGLGWRRLREDHRDHRPRQCAGRERLGMGGAEYGLGCPPWAWASARLPASARRGSRPRTTR